jgi:hypothetical protein
MVAMAMVFIDQILFDDEDNADFELEQQLLSLFLSESFTHELVSVIAATALDALAQYDNPRKRTIESSENDDDQQPPRRRRSRWDWDRARSAIWNDYMSPTPIFDDRQFDRMFRVTRSVMEELRTILGNVDSFFTEKICSVTGKTTICADAKILCALKQLAFGTSPYAFLDYFQMGEATARQSLLRFARAISNSDELRERFFRPMTKADARNVCALHQNQHGIDGMAGSLDCMHVSWKNCPVAWQGQFQGKESYPSIVLEAMCDYNLYFWHHEFGSAGTLNDINIWDMSGLHKAFVDGSWSENVDFEYTINGQLFDKLWVTVDGIYPPIARFVKTLSQPVGKKQQNYAKWQEKTRKDIERGFGVLQSKFRYLVQRVEMWNFENIISVVNCCLLLHNWMVTIRMQRDEQESIDWYDVARDSGEDGEGSTMGDGGENGEGSNNGDSGNNENGGISGYDEENEIVPIVDAHMDVSNTKDSPDPESRTFLLAMKRNRNVFETMRPSREKLIQQRWVDLYDIENFHRLQRAIYNELEEINWNFNT